MLDQSIDKPLINVPGCPPIPEVITGVILTYLASGFTVPALDSLKRPQAFYRRTVHSNCYRREFYEEGPFAMSFDDQNARAGGCLYGLGCKGPVTHNACSTIKWNQGTSFPMMSGHGCIGCAEPDFWDRIDQYGDKGFYLPLDGSGGAFGHSGGQPCSQCHGGGSSSRSVGAESGDDDNERSERSERRSGRRGNDD
jgi:hydrogenase small subunit